MGKGCGMPVKCKICGAELIGDRRCCPLCGTGFDSALEQEDYGCYPVVPVHLTYRVLDWIIGLWGVVALAVLLVLRFTVLKRLPYFWLLCLGVACLHVTLLVGIRKWRNLPKSVMYEALLGAGLSILWDVGTGWHGWSLNFVLPILGGVLEIFYFALILSGSRKRNAYGIYFVTASVWAGVVLLLAITEVITLWLPTAVAVATAVVLMAALLLLRGRDFLSEVHRRFHL